MPARPSPATIPEAIHEVVQIDGSPLHYVSAGDAGSPVLLVHGFPESWWAFRGVIPVLARRHRVIAVDLPGFGDSGHHGEVTSGSVAGALRELIDRLGLGPVHLTGQDISGAATFRLAAAHPDRVASYAAIETGLAGFGLEMLADVTRGGAWHIGAVATPGIPELLLAGRERDFLTRYAFPAMVADPHAITDRDIDEFTRVYAGTDGFAGAAGLYRAMLSEGDEIRRIVDAGRLTMPVLSVAAGTGPFTHAMTTAIAEQVTQVDLPGIGHLAALEDPEALGEALLSFYGRIDPL